MARTNKAKVNNIIHRLKYPHTGKDMFTPKGFRVLIKDYSTSWDDIISAYNMCLSIYREKELSEDSGVGFFLAKTALKDALSPGLANELKKERAFMMIGDFLVWYSKTFPELKLTS